MTGRARVNREAIPNGRLLVISELLRMGHRPADIIEALKHTDEGDLEGALKILTQKATR